MTQVEKYSEELSASIQKMREYSDELANAKFGKKAKWRKLIRNEEQNQKRLTRLIKQAERLETKELAIEKGLDPTVKGAISGTLQGATNLIGAYMGGKFSQGATDQKAIESGVKPPSESKNQMLMFGFIGLILIFVLKSFNNNTQKT